MDRYKEIREIILNISRSELNVIKEHIACYQSAKKSNAKESNDLLTAIADFPEKSEVEILKKIGFKPTSKNISIFYRSTRNLINEGLTLDVNVHRQFEYSNGFRNKTGSRKKIILAEILLNKGLSENAQLILEEVISKSTKYEEFDQVIEAYELLKLDCIAHSNVKEFDRIEGELLVAEEQRSAIHLANKVYQNVLLHASLPLPKARIATINTALKKIQEKSQKAQSEKVTYFANLIEAEKHFVKGDFEESRILLEKILVNVNTKPPIQSTQREAQILLKIAACEVAKGDYKRAKPNYEKAANFYKKSDYENYSILNKMLFLDFYLGNYKEIKKHIELRTKSKYISSFQYAVAQYNLFNGALIYLSGKSEKAGKMLFSMASPSNDISFETQLGINYILLISGLDSLKNNKSLADKWINTAFKNIENLKAKNSFSKRDKLIIRVLKKLKGREFDFELSKPAIESNMADLMSSSEYAWAPFSHEIIRIDKWVQSRTSK